MRNPAWTRDELILALSLYFKLDHSDISSSNPRIIHLSEILNRLPIHHDRPNQAVFRNPNGVAMKLSNFLRLDPTYHGKGLQQGGKLEVEIWNQFYHQQGVLHHLADLITTSVKSIGQQLQFADSAEEEFPEGKILYRMHRYYERNSGVVRKKKKEAALNGPLKCCVCNFDFGERYGELGKGYIECHHTVPVSQLSGVKTKVTDLVLVCSNCHKMLHRRRPWLNIYELKDILKGEAGS